MAVSNGASNVWVWSFIRLPGVVGEVTSRADIAGVGVPVVPPAVAVFAARGAVAAAGLGTDATFCRMSGLKPFVALSWKPTAATVPSLRAVTPLSPLSKSPGLGLLMMLQLVPFHCSTRVV